MTKSVPPARVGWDIGGEDTVASTEYVTRAHAEALRDAAVLAERERIAAWCDEQRRACVREERAKHDPARNGAKASSYSATATYIRALN